MLLVILEIHYACSYLSSSSFPTYTSHSLSDQECGLVLLLSTLPYVSMGKVRAEEGNLTESANASKNNDAHLFSFGVIGDTIDAFLLVTQHILNIRKCLCLLVDYVTQRL